MNWSRGRTLLTHITQKYSKEQWERNESVEKSMIFSNFSPLDSGRSREQICTLNTNHYDYELNGKLIELTPKLLEDSKKLYNLALELAKLVDYSKFPTLREEWNKVMENHESIIKQIPEPQKHKSEKRNWEQNPLTSIFL